MNEIAHTRGTNQGTRPLALLLVALLLHTSAPALLFAFPAPPKLKVKGYITARMDESMVAILDDHIQLTKGGHVVPRDTSTGQTLTFAGLAAGQLVEAEGTWQGKHQFLAELITVEPGLIDKSVHEAAYLQGEPPDAVSYTHLTLPTIYSV